MSAMFALKRADALKEVRAVVRVVDGWKQHFKAAGVTRGDIESYAEQIDRPFLVEQRAEHRAGKTPK
jgi:serine/threonine-protein kinase HipA